MSLLDPDEQTLTAVTAGPFGANRVISRRTKQH
jgi:hypothetical protein